MMHPMTNPYYVHSEHFVIGYHHGFAMKKENDMLTDRDIEMLKFINIYGRTFFPVLGNTFFNSEQLARGRIGKLFDQKCIRYMDTNLLKIRKAIVLSSDTKTMLFDMGIEPKKVSSGLSTIKHNIIEQIAHFWLLKIGEVERTSVAKHGKKLAHVPDMILTLQSGAKIFVEIETTKKTLKRYEDIFEKIKSDQADQVLYIVPKEKDLLRYASFLPSWDKVRIIDIDTLIENVQKTGKVSAKAQNDLRIG